MTACAMSAGLAGRRIGARVLHNSWAAVQSAVSGVSTRPGATAFTLMAGAKDNASSRVTWLSAALVAAYGIEAPFGRTPACELMFTPQVSSDIGKYAGPVLHVA